MPKWELIETAPDGPIMLRTLGGAEFPGHYEYTGFLDDDENDCGCWVAEEEGNHPDCWDDGVCWATNSAGEPSDPPTHWAPSPPEGV